MLKAAMAVVSDGSARAPGATLSLPHPQERTDVRALSKYNFAIAPDKAGAKFRMET